MAQSNQNLIQQRLLINDEKTNEIQEWGTFKDSIRAPIHNWFTYPAGFSFKAVAASFKHYGIQHEDAVYDPFMGSGTTNLTAKTLGINSYGVEAHPFVFRIARTKMNWQLSREEIIGATTQIEELVRTKRRKFSGDLQKTLDKEFPELILKCYEDTTLLELWFVREAIEEAKFSNEIKDLMFVGLTGVLRKVSTAATGWPYIAPKKQKTSSIGKDALTEFSLQLSRMANDIEMTRKDADITFYQTTHRLFNSDSRNTCGSIPSQVIDHVFTSPPYLNNFDYADRTRLELYFFGQAKNWADISENIRTKLITSATTQISRDDPRYILSPILKEAAPETFNFLQDAIGKLAVLRKTKGGKKSYDHLVSGYFNDMLLVISDVYRVLKPNTTAVFVLGDSAPYGVYIPTDKIVGEIGLGVGFSDCKFDTLRERGGKWKANPQRHNVMLRESIVTLRKG